MDDQLPAEQLDVGILVIDDDLQTQSALAHILHTEGWRVSVVPLVRQGLEELAKAEWSLVVANVAMVDLSGGPFETLTALARSSSEPGRRRVRVLFLVPELAAPGAQPVLEQLNLPYVFKPLHLHDFLERVSDLLIEAGALREPIRRMRGESSTERKQKARQKREKRPTEMFASREDYYMTEEEIAEYEKQEAEEQKKQKTRRR